MSNSTGSLCVQGVLQLSQHFKIIFGILGLIMSVTYSYDLLSYSSKFNLDLFYLAKLIIFILSGAFLAWCYLVKPRFVNSKGGKLSIND